MNRPGKHSEVDLSLAAARAAGELDSGAVALRRKPRDTGTSTTTRLLQLVSLFVLFVFGMVGCSMFTLRHTGMSRVVLQHGISRLKQHLESPSEMMIKHGRPPIYLPLIALNFGGGERILSHDRDGTLKDFAQRFSPEMFVVQNAPSPASMEMIERGLPRHARVTNCSETDVFYNQDAWQVLEHGSYPLHVNSENQDAVTWVRLQYVVPKKTCTGRHTMESNKDLIWVMMLRSRRDAVASMRSQALRGVWQRNTTILIASMAVTRRVDSKADVDILRRVIETHSHPLEPVIIFVGVLCDDSTPRELLEPIGLVDAFSRLHLLRQSSIQSTEEAPPKTPSVRDWVFANNCARPVSAMELHFASPVDGAGSHVPLSVVYELLPPDTNVIDGEPTK